jgi:formate hydrogenlyase transcriptional activator
MVAATHRDLKTMMAENRFRSDLYYRLNVIPIAVPPLRERREDIPLLVDHFVQHFAAQMGKTIDTIRPETMDVLTGYPWRGNIRELQNLMERAVILSKGPVLCVPLPQLRTGTSPDPEHEKNHSLADAERRHILAILKEAEWVLSGPNGAAARLGINRSTLQYRMRKLGIVRPGTMWIGA